MDGIIIVNKPPGWTSFDVVAKIRGLTRVQKVGHSGTLDPMATGVLPVFLGRATKSIQYFLNGDKGYEGDMTLGVTTDTGDAEGKLQTSNIQLQNNWQITMTKEQIEEAFKKYIGEIEQVPPMYSAIKIKGQRLYDLARRGIEVKRESRKITIYDLRVTHYASPLVSFSVLCSKGTYIRQLAVDIGDDLGCGAHLSRLVRTYAHPFRLSQAHDLETIVTLAKIGQLDSIIIPVEAILTPERR
ncbi:MAG: tRNA pseudouridine(55) synthase TruB [Candidatus Margulisiibacteriota bacterium]